MSGSEGRLDNIIALANETVKVLQDRLDFTSSLVDEINTQIAMLPLTKYVASSMRRRQLDQLGVNIWNAAANLVEDQQNIPTASQDSQGNHRYSTMHGLSITLQVFAYFLIDAAYQCSPTAARPLQKVLRVFQIALKAISACLSQDELAYSLKILGESATYVTVIGDVVSADSCDEGTMNHPKTCVKLGRQLILEHHLSRILHSWKTGNLGLADFFTHKITSRELNDIPHLRSKAARLYTLITHQLVKEQQHNEAMNWLAKTESLLFESNITADENLDLYLDHINTQVNCMMEIQPSQARDKALELIEKIEGKAGLKEAFPTQLTRFCITAKTASQDASSLLTDLLGMIHTASNSEDCCKSILQAANFLKQRDSVYACQALQTFLACFFFDDDCMNSDFPEKGICFDRTVITLTIFATDAENHCFDLLEQCYNDIEESRSYELPQMTVHAAQTLIWKSLGTAKDDANEKACTLLSHPIFANASTINKACIARKTMSMALDRDELETAQQAYNGMPEAHRDDLSSRYLAFKLALRSQDFDFARDCLEIVVMQSSQHPNFLYACIIEAHQSGCREMAILTLSALIDLSPAGIHLPALLRCTAQLLLSQVESGNDLAGHNLDSSIRIFEAAASQINDMQLISGEQWPLEVQWWVKKTYNLALQPQALAHPQALIGLLKSCLQFIDSALMDSNTIQVEGFQKRRISCIVLLTGAYIMLGRTSPDTHSSKDHYLQAQQQLEAFFTLPLDDKVTNKDDDISRWTFELLKFQLECALRLEEWNQVDETLERCANHEVGDRWDILADLVILLQYENPTGPSPTASANVPKVLQKAINKTWSLDRDVSKVARWIRIALSACLESSSGSSSSSNSDTELSLDLVKQAAGIARRGHEGNSSGGGGYVAIYPEAELQWLAAMAFNHAVDCLDDAAAGYSEARRWADAALELAYWASDNGSLHANLTGRVRVMEARYAS